MQAANGSLSFSAMQPHSTSATSTIPWVEILVGCLFAACLCCLTHDLDYLTSGEGESVEAGRGMDTIEKFHKNVNAAPLPRKLGFLGLLSIGFFCLATAPRNTYFTNKLVICLAGCCLAWLAASFLWSDDWRHTAREFVRVAAYAFIALSIALRFRPHQVCLVIMLALAGSVFAASGASVLTGDFRPWSSEFRLHGTLHSNLLAHQAMVVLLIAVALLPAARRVWFWRLLIISMIAVIVLTKTRGALASSILGVVTIKMVGRSFWSIAMVTSVLATCFLALALLVVVASSKAQSQLGDVLIMGRSEGLTTLTGRIPLWEAVWHEARGNRLKGFGYGAFWSIERTETLADELQWFPRHSHSAYVHTILDLGYIGISLVLMLVFACLAAALRGYRATKDVAYSFFLGFLLAGLLDGLVEISYVSPRELGLFVGIVIMSLIVAHPEITDESVEELGELPGRVPKTV